MATHVPCLATKLDLLYSSGRNPDITTHEALAGFLGLRSKASISNWISGDGGCKQYGVPSKHIPGICDAFLISREILLSAEAPGWFEKQIAQSDAGWHTLLTLAQESVEQLRMVRADTNLPLVRGVTEYPDGAEGSIWIPVSSVRYATSSFKRGLSRPLPRMRTLCTN